MHLPLTTFRAVIFDMDGTMINNMPYHKQAWQAFFKRHQLTLTEDEFRRKVSGKKNDQIFTEIFDRPLSPDEVAQYTEEKEALYRELYAPHIQEVGGLTSLITELRDRDIKIAIATTAPAKNREFALRELGLEGKFDVILGDEHVAHGKPNPEVVHQGDEEKVGQPEDPERGGIG